MGSGVPSFVASGGGSKYYGLENDRCPRWSMGHSKYAGGYWELWIHDFKIKSTHWFFCAMSKRNGCKSQDLGGKRWSDRWWVEREGVYYQFEWIFVGVSFCVQGLRTLEVDHICDLKFRCCGISIFWHHPPVQGSLYRKNGRRENKTQMIHLMSLNDLWNQLENQNRNGSRCSLLCSESWMHLTSSLECLKAAFVFCQYEKCVMWPLYSLLQAHGLQKC